MCRICQTVTFKAPELQQHNNVLLCFSIWNSQWVKNKEQYNNNNSWMCWKAQCSGFQNHSGKEPLKGQFLALCLGIFLVSCREGAKNVNVMSWGQEQHDHLLLASSLPCYLTFYRVKCLLQLKPYEIRLMGNSPEVLRFQRHISFSSLILTNKVLMSYIGLD